MGNEQEKISKVQQIKPEPIVQPSVQNKKFEVNDDCLIDQIQLEKSKTITESKPELKKGQIHQTPKQKPQIEVHNSNKKTTITKQLPPLKIRNSRTIGAPLENCQNYKTNHILQDLQEINYDKNVRSNEKTSQTIQETKNYNKQNGKNQRQNITSQKRTKKFRPSDATRKNSTALSNYPNQSETKQHNLVQ